MDLDKYKLDYVIDKGKESLSPSSFIFNVLVNFIFIIK